jgi:hypothetical protein
MVQRRCICLRFTCRLSFIEASWRRCDCEINNPDAVNLNPLWN